MNNSLPYKKLLNIEIMQIIADKSIKKNPDFDYKTIKTFDDACRKIKHSGSIPLVSIIPEKFRKFVIAYFKLLVIYEAINDGWIPDWSDKRQQKYFPLFEAVPSEPELYSIRFSSTIIKNNICSVLFTQSSEKTLFIAEHFKDFYIDYLFLPR